MRVGQTVKRVQSVSVLYVAFQTHKIKLRAKNMKEGAFWSLIGSA